jgi:hypothetical protein
MDPFLQEHQLVVQEIAMLMEFLLIVKVMAGHLMDLRRHQHLMEVQLQQAQELLI